MRDADVLLVEAGQARCGRLRRVTRGFQPDGRGDAGWRCEGEGNVLCLNAMTAKDNGMLENQIIRVAW